MRIIVYPLLAALGGCLSSSSGDDCIPLDGLFLHSSAADRDDLFTAVGGTQHYLAFADECKPQMVQVPLILAYSESPAVATAKVVDGAAVVTGVGVGKAIIDMSSDHGRPTLPVNIIPIDHVELANPVVATDTAYVTIVLRAADQTPAIDDSATISGALAQGDRWDRVVIGHKPPGDYAITIHAGGADWPLTITVQ